MRDLIEAVWRLPRDLVSDGYDRALAVLAGQIPLIVHEYPTGEPCFTWTVPEKWTCRRARLETLDGRVLLDREDNPLHVASYSIPFDGVVSREELLEHLHVHPRLPDAIPFAYCYYRRDWGLCCTSRLRDTLDAPRYRVVIDSEFSPGTLKVGEMLLTGESEDAIVLCAHLCHPAMVNDDLSGVVAGMEVMRRLAARPARRFTYRLVLLPETIGSAAYLSHNLDAVGKMRGGLFLEMLGTAHPHALQRSFAGDTPMDRCAALTLAEADPQARVEDFLKVILNDERMFNAPGIRVPMVSLSRVLPADHPEHPYAEYHTSLDTPDRVDFAHLEASCDLVLSILDALEYDHVPRPLFRGELFFSRYGFDYEALKYHLFDVMFHLDGELSASAIAARIGAPFSLVRRCLEHMDRCGLIEKAPLAWPPRRGGAP